MFRQWGMRPYLGISVHMGSRAFPVMEMWRRVRNYIGVKDDSKVPSLVTERTVMTLTELESEDASKFGGKMSSVRAR